MLNVSILFSPAHLHFIESLFQFRNLFPNYESELSELILDFDDEGAVLVSVDKGLVQHLKPHQRDGIKFMWDACFESCNILNESTGGGCILAHCMGLGKFGKNALQMNGKSRDKIL